MDEANDSEHVSSVCPLPALSFNGVSVTMVSVSGLNNGIFASVSHPN